MDSASVMNDRPARRSANALVIVGAIAAALGCLRPTAGDEAGKRAMDLESRFRDQIRPFLEDYCVRCHGREKPKGDVDLSAFTTSAQVARDLERFELVLEQLEADTMPPAKTLKRPDASRRESVIAWIKSVRKAESARHAGDPGTVPARRLSNAEYDNTIRDLTGADIRPTREFPVDPANEAGFDNSAESLTMSPALFKKYLEAARRVAEHAVLTPEGIDFAPYPALADTDRDRYCVRRVIGFYQQQKTDFADFFLAAWKYRTQVVKEVTRRPLEVFADEAGLSRKYLARVWAALEGKREEIGPIAALQMLWRALPSAPGRITEARAGCERMRDFVVELRKQLVPRVPDIRTRGIQVGSQPLVLWKNRQMAANRMHYRGGADSLRLNDLHLTPGMARALEAPAMAAEFKRFEATFEPFCNTFPDAFYISERARTYVKNDDKDNAGRLLSAGFHSMTGYFRDDEPLSELILDGDGKRTLDRLWREFDFITRAPLRQYASYLWYERAETGFLRGDPRFDFVRAEDPDASSEARMSRFEKSYLAKAHEVKASELAIHAVEEQFRIIANTIRRVERDRHEAEPKHVAALAAFAERAYRRPLTTPEQAGFAAFYRTLRDQDGLAHEDAVRDTLVSILVSPKFLYRVDVPGSGGAVRALGDYDLASRLSYFLWASMPDDALRLRAARGELRRLDVLAAEARRMLRDDKVRGLATEFAGNWLDFRRFEEHNSVDRRRFPTFNDALRQAMFEEPVRYFVDAVQHDRPVAELIDGKHTFVNTTLARHYGMPAPASGWSRVDDAGRFGRGGLLPMAVFLTKNSPGLRTSPVKRGYWVVKRVLGENIPAPPPNVPALPEDEKNLGSLTLREALERHRADKACASCHARFDSYGLVFEGYGPVGERRDVDLGGRPVDTRASFPGGGEGAGIEGLRTFLQGPKRSAFVENLCRKLLAYALGRTLIPSDDAVIDAMIAKTGTGEGGFGDLVEIIVTSPQFRTKRFASDQGDPAP